MLHLGRGYEEFILGNYRERYRRNYLHLKRSQQIQSHQRGARSLTAHLPPAGVVMGAINQ